MHKQLIDLLAPPRPGRLNPEGNLGLLHPYWMHPTLQKAMSTGGYALRSGALMTEKMFLLV
tara:strand:- start:7186 stop:7368 length:183 start_codon:yes stop_codon:yes gene_type:complete